MRGSSDAVVRTSFLIATMVAAGGAGQANSFLAQPVMAEATLSSAPDPAARATLPSGFTPAPLPDFDRAAPVGEIQAGAHVAPKLFRKHEVFHGEGYVFGSAQQDKQDDKIQPAPGINLIMPLQ